MGILELINDNQRKKGNLYLRISSLFLTYLKVACYILLSSLSNCADIDIQDRYNTFYLEHILDCNIPVYQYIGQVKILKEIKSSTLD